MALKLNEPLGTIDSMTLANYVLFRVGRMSNLKLQKLLFYIHAYHLAYFETPLIEDEFEAWVHGPVSRKVFMALRDTARLYDELSYHQEEGEDTPDVSLQKVLTDDQMELIDDVLDEYGVLTGLQLENLTHSEDPWISTRGGLPPGEKCDKVIPNDLIQKYYKDQLYQG